MLVHQSLLHPELLQQVPLTGGLTANRLSGFVDETAALSTHGLPGVSLIIRTLNEAAQLEGLFNDVEQQRNANDLQVIVVDNESTDKTQAIARSYGATVVELARDGFTYPRSLNAGVEVADNPVVYLTVGHARLSNRQTFVAAARHFRDKSVAGVFSRVLPGENASDIERLIAMGNLAYMKPAHEVKKAGMGVLAAQNAAISKEAWQRLGKFDENYELGGEDRAFAGRALESGLKIIEDPVVAVHHTHGLGVVNTARQWYQWVRMLKGPQTLNMEALLRRRPDLRERLEN